MKVVAINGSARKGGNTASLLAIPCANLKKKASKPNWWNSAAPKSTAASPAAMFDEEESPLLAGKRHGERVYREDGRGGRILLGSPTYVADVSSEIKALMDRACLVSKANGGMFRHKVGAGVGGSAPGGRHACFRRPESFLSDQRNDRAGLVLLEYRHRAMSSATWRKTQRAFRP